MLRLCTSLYQFLFCWHDGQCHLFQVISDFGPVFFASTSCNKLAFFFKWLYFESEEILKVTQMQQEDRLHLLHWSITRVAKLRTVPMEIEGSKKTSQRQSGMTTREMKDYPNLCLCRLCSVFIIFFSLLCILHRNRLCPHQILITGRILWMAIVWNGVHA